MNAELPQPLSRWRREYADRGLDAADLGDDPIEAFRAWLLAAQVAGLHEPNAMVVSTTGPDGPSSRLVLLKGLDERGFVFYTNYSSRKAAELAGDPRCALLFPWHPVQRQVRIEGVASHAPDAESDAYFASRPRGAQLGAWASPQSQVITSRDVLETALDDLQSRFGDGDVPAPPHWGGYRLSPESVEFWQGRPDRLHDRLRFRLDGGAWVLERLAP